MTKRFYDDIKYKNARLAVLKRDKYVCLNCKSARHIQVHHIKKWATHPTLRYEITNMISLCKRCHKNMWSKEEEWEGYCLLLLNKEKALDINYLLWKLKQEEEEDE